MKKNIKSIAIGVLVGISVLSVSAYNTQIWSPIQFVKQLFVTPNGELDPSKAVIKIDGTKGSIEAKSVKVNGEEVATKKDLETAVKNVKIKLPICKKGEVLTSEDGRNFKCVKGGNSEITIVDYDGGRRWSNGTYAKSCLGYRKPHAPYKYAGSIGDGIYWIKPDGVSKPFKVYCDNTSLSYKLDKTVSTYFDGCYGGRYSVSKSSRPPYIYRVKYSDLKQKDGRGSYLCTSYKGTPYCIYPTKKNDQYWEYDFTNDNVRRCGSPAWDLCSWSSYRCKANKGHKFIFEVYKK